MTCIKNIVKIDSGSLHRILVEETSGDHGTLLTIYWYEAGHYRSHWHRRDRVTWEVAEREGIADALRSAFDILENRLAELIVLGDAR